MGEENVPPRAQMMCCGVPISQNTICSSQLLVNGQHSVEVKTIDKLSTTLVGNTKLDGELLGTLPTE